MKKIFFKKIVDQKKTIDIGERLKYMNENILILRRLVINTLSDRRIRMKVHVFIFD